MAEQKVKGRDMYSTLYGVGLKSHMTKVKYQSHQYNLPKHGYLLWLAFLYLKNVDIFLFIYKMNIFNGKDLAYDSCLSSSLQ